MYELASMKFCHTLAPDSKALAALFALQTLSTPFLWAEESRSSVTPDSSSVDGRLDELSITAARAKRSKKEISLSTASVSGDDIQASTPQSILDSLRDIPGVSISANGSNGLKSVRIRGEASRRTLILVDGQPMSQQKSMTGGMALIGLSQIDRIEVVKGPASVLYGSEAIGGVVNIITKKGGDSPFGGSLNWSYDSSNNGFRQDYEIHGSLDNGFEYNFSYGKSDFDDRETATRTLDNDGYMLLNPTKKRVGGTGSNSEEYSAYFGYKKENMHLGIRYNYFDSAYEIFTNRGGPTSDMMMDIPNNERESISGFFELTDITEAFKKVRLDVYRNANQREFDIINQMNFVPFPVGEFGIHIHNEQLTHGVDFQTDWEFGKHHLIVGVVGNHDDIDGTTKDRTVLPGLPFASYHYDYDAEMATGAVFLQDEWLINDATRVIGGMRYTYVKSKFNGSNDPTLAGIKEKSSDDNLAFSLGAVHELNAQWTLRANYSQGYRHANLVELYTGVPPRGMGAPIAGNPDLDPETSHNFEVGGIYEDDCWITEFAVFYTMAEDYITTNATQFINVGGADTLGGELSVAYKIADFGLTPYVSATVLHRELDYGNLGSVGKTSDSGVAPFSARYGVRYETVLKNSDQLNIDIFARSTAKVEREYADGSKDSSDSWTTVNLDVRYNMGEVFSRVSMEVFGGVYNVFGEDYTPFDELQGAGRYAVIGMKLNF